MRDEPNNTRGFVLDRDGHRCRYCGQKNKIMQVDHVYPLSLGGADRAENMVTCCYSCNQKKGWRLGAWPYPVWYFQNPWMRLFRSWLARVMGLEYSLAGVEPRAASTEDKQVLIVRIVNHETQEERTALSLPVDRDKFIEFARMALAQDSFSHSLSGPGKPVSRNELEKIRFSLLDCGFLEWKNPKYRSQGFRITQSGYTFLRGIAGEAK